jgi:hypothetical protein
MPLNRRSGAGANLLGHAGRVLLCRRSVRLFEMRIAFVAAATVGILVIALPIAASGGANVSKIRSETLACFSQEGAPYATAAPSYVGLSVSKAVKKVRRTEDDYRIIAKDGKCFPSTADLKKDRVNFWIFHGKVIKASTF